MSCCYQIHLFRSIGRLLSTELSQSRDMLLAVKLFQSDFMLLTVRTIQSSCKLQSNKVFQSIYMLQLAAVSQSHHPIQFPILVSFIFDVTNDSINSITDYVTNSLLKIQSVHMAPLSSGDSIKCYDTICLRVSFGIFVTVYWVDSFCSNDTVSSSNSIPG